MAPELDLPTNPSMPPPDDLKAPKRALRKHGDRNLKGIEASIKEHGFLTPILVDSNRRIVAGYGRTPTATVREIFDLVRQYDAVLATGHISAAEHYAIVKAFARTEKVLVTHAGEALAGPNLSAAQARELADLGAMIELTAECCVPVFNRPPKSARTMADMIYAIGHDRCTLSSDYGWSTAVPKPAQGLKDFLEKLWDVGVAEAELTRMVSINPSRLLSID